MGLDAILKGRGLMTMAEYEDLINKRTFISTGYPELDNLIQEGGGGIPRNCITELYGVSSCVGATTKIFCKLNGKHTYRSIGVLYHRLYGGKCMGHNAVQPRKPIDTLEVRCLNEKTGFLEWVPADVIYQGRKAMDKVWFEGGEIRATGDHKFLTERGWKQMRELTLDDKIVMANSKPTSVVDMHTKVTTVKYHPTKYSKMVNGYKYHQLAEHILVYEAYKNGMSTDEYRNLLNNYNGEKIWTVPNGMHIHHKNGDHSDNRIENLECLTPKEHAAIHHAGNREMPFGTHYVPIKRIQRGWSCGDVFDIKCFGDHHNFVANGVIVHNCGKSRFCKNIAIRSDIKALYIDTENSLPADEFKFLKEHGVDCVSENVIENIWGVVNDVLEQEHYDLIIVDSLAAMVSNDELAADNEQTMSTRLAQAKAMTQWMKQLVRKLNGSNTAFIFVNHKKIAPGPVPIVNTPGGSSPKYYSSLRLDFKANKKDIKGTVQKLEVEIAKSRFSSKNTSIKIPLELDWRKLDV